MFDLALRYRECGAECREDWLRNLACENGLPLAEVERAAARLGEREDFGRLVDWCEGPRCDYRSSRKRSIQSRLSDCSVQVHRHFGSIQPQLKNSASDP